ncbi:PorV/PorQ family protein [Flammeovirgaceae bacterium SG7u.111]|nr:PorV/PorQ family protein [Flammeovirgaceae bacterium SG7u.132]WPO34609.1 PorV/PorQ family protein [Flammeovirgaceae bacterium SG7u.111]
MFMLLGVQIAVAQQTPKYSNEFLAIGVGARGMAMSNSQVSIVDDATAGYWNPAGLLNIKEKYSVSAMHASYFAGIANYDYVGFATPVDKRSHIGVTLIRFAVDDIPDTRFLFDANGSLNYDNIRSFSAADYAFMFSYARRSLLVKGLKLGANFKVIHRSVGIFANAWGFGIDIGAQLDRKNWHFGLAARDVTGTYNTWNYNPDTFYEIFSQTGNTIPNNSVEVTLPRILGGVAYSVRIKNKFGALLAAEFDMTLDGKRNTVLKTDAFSLDPHVGLELDYQQLVYLRGGVGQFQEIKNFDGTTYMTFQPNFGVGIRLKNFVIDYALTDIGDSSEALYSHVFSIKLGMGKSKFTKPRFEYEQE